MSIETFIAPQAPEAAAKANYSCPDATLILRVGADQEEWLEARTQGLGGSDASGIAGFNKYNPPYKVWLSKTGQDKSRRTYNQAMRMGHLMEPILKKMFTEDTGIKVRQAGLMRSKKHPFMQVTVDGLTEDGGIFESKTSTGWLSAEWEDGQVPDHAELQVQHGMAVTGRSHAWVVGLLDGREWFIRRIERNEAIIEMLIEMEEHFWSNYVLTGMAPPVNAMALDALKGQHGEATPETFAEFNLEDLESLKAAYDDAKAREKAAKADADDVNANLRLIVGDTFGVKVEGTDQIFAKLANDGQFSESKFKADDPELWEKLQVATTKLDMDTIKAEHPEIYTKYRARVLRFPKPKAAKKAGK